MKTYINFKFKMSNFKKCVKIIMVVMMENKTITLTLDDATIIGGINWYYHNVEVLNWK